MAKKRATTSAATGSAPKRASAATKKAPPKAAAKTGGSSRKTTTAAKAAGAKAAGAKAAGAKAAGAKAAGTRAAGAKAAGTKAAGATAPRKAAKRQFTGIRTVLARRQAELREEYDSAMAELDILQRDRVGDSAGDDQADAGTKTFEREQEISLTNSIVDRLGQVDRALERIDEGTYGFCERCGKHIPKARLEAFPSVTLCIACKQHEERR